MTVGSGGCSIGTTKSPTSFINTFAPLSAHFDKYINIPISTQNATGTASLFNKSCAYGGAFYENTSLIGYCTGSPTSGSTVTTPYYSYNCNEGLEGILPFVLPLAKKGSNYKIYVIHKYMPSDNQLWEPWYMDITITNIDVTTMTYKINSILGICHIISYTPQTAGTLLPCLIISIVPY